MIKGIIFDFDGTLANTLPVIFACYDYSTEKVLGKKADRAPFIETFGQPLYVCLTSIFGEEKGSRICDEYRAYQEIHHDELIRPFPGVKETLEQLQQLHIPMAVVTLKIARERRAPLGYQSAGFDENSVSVFSSSHSRE